MIIYSTRIWLGCTFDVAWNTAGEWVARKLKAKVTDLGFETDGALTSDKYVADWLVQPHEMGHLAACRFSHPDNKIEGRTWVTDIGVRDSQHPKGLVEATVTLRTDDASTLVAMRPETTRPFLVKQWMDQCHPAEMTAGWCVDALYRDNASDFLAWVENPKRPHPILILSPEPSGSLILEPRHVLFFLGGMADIAVVEHGHAEAIKKVLGERYAAWNGAAKILYPKTRGKIPVDKISRDDLSLMAVQEEREHGRDLLETIAHRVNPSNQSYQLTLEGVREHRLLRQLERQTSDTDALHQLLEEAGDDQRKLQELREALNDRDMTIEQYKEENQRLLAERDALQLSLHYQQAEHREVDARLLALREFFINAVEDDATPEEILRLIEAFFPDRVMVLESAYRSAKDAPDFDQPEAAFKLILTLVTSYYEALIQGGGDAKAGQAFGQNKYAATESETVMHNRNARNARTFTYKGQPVEMLRHLKLGVKDSAHKTLRVHFHWDAEDRKIIIGHCGAHLPHG
jgi:hypothetical protein